MSMQFALRGIPEDSEFMRLALADAPGMRDLSQSIMFRDPRQFPKSFWEEPGTAPLRDYLDNYPDLIDLYACDLDCRYGELKRALLGMVRGTPTAEQERIAELIQGGSRELFNPPQGVSIVSSEYVPEIARFLDSLDPSCKTYWADTLKELKSLFRRAASTPRVAVLSLYS